MLNRNNLMSYSVGEQSQIYSNNSVKEKNMRKTFSWSIAIIFLGVLIYFIFGYAKSIRISESVINSNAAFSQTEVTKEDLSSYLLDNNDILSNMALSPEAMQFLEWYSF